MDKITAVIVLLVIGFWGYLKFYHGAESWVAMMNDGSGELEVLVVTVSALMV